MKVNEKEYLERNRLGFEGDEQMKMDIESIIKKNNIKLILETGTYLGSSTKVMAEFGSDITIHTVEVNREYYNKSVQYLKGINNAIIHFGSSVDVMDKLLGNQHFQSTPFFWFCDSHWGSNNPLLQELNLFYKYNLKPIIAIHDFKVPGTTLGYDSYNGQDYQLDWIKPSLDRIYGDNGYNIQYNDEKTAIGAKRGIIYVFPKDSEDKKEMKISKKRGRPKGSKNNKEAK